MMRDLVDYAAQVANALLVPEGFPHDMWRDLGSPSNASMSACSTWRPRAQRRSPISRTSPRALPSPAMPTSWPPPTANAASLAGAADLKGRMLSGDGFEDAASAGAVRDLEDDGGRSATPSAA